MKETPKKEKEEVNKTRFIHYVGYTSVLIVSFVAAWLLPIGDITKDIMAVPGIGALALLLIQLWRDNRAHERAVELQNKQQDFMLGTASHMAEVAYDKHILFCEEYIEQLQKVLQGLYRDGPSKGSIDMGRKLVNIRQKHSAWLTKDIENKLKPVEGALIKMGAKEYLLDHLEVGPKRSKTVNRVYDLFEKILGEGSDEDKQIAVSGVIEIIRKILGIEILTELRIKAVELAKKRLNG